MTARVSRRTLLLFSLVTITTLSALAWNKRGLANIVYRIAPVKDGLRRGDKQFIVSTFDVNRTVNFTEHLRNAYSPTKGHINPHNFKLLIDEPMVCMDSKQGTPKQVLLLVLVTSTHGSFDRRQAIRTTWGSPKELGGLPVVTLFILAKNGEPILEEKVSKESAEYHDLLMEDFRDSYKNLTLKTLMAMKWASTHCPQASFVMKTDDDMFVSYQNLLNYVAASKPLNVNLAFGLVLAGQAPIRNQRNKWYMSKELYPGDVYPPWLSGGGFVLSGDVPGKIYTASLDIRYLHLEDVYVGVCLEKLKITPITNGQFNNMHVQYSHCKFRNLITSHHVDPAELKTIWEDQRLQKPCWFWT